MSQKVLIVALVVLVILFIVSVGVGCGQRDNRDIGGNPLGPLKSLDSNRFLVIGQDASGCAPPGVSQFQSPCAITFNDRGRFKKPTKVAFDVLTGTVRVRLLPTHGTEQAATVPEDGNSCYASSMDPRGGTLQLNDKATIRLRSSTCPKQG